MTRCIKVDPHAYAAEEPTKYWDPFAERDDGPTLAANSVS